MAGGKTYQVTQVDPLNPHTKGMVYQVNIVGGGTQMEELPEASADNVGQVYQYLGETGSGLTHGFFYESQALGTNPETYGWVAVNVQQGGATNSATTDMSNLTATGANIGNWSSNVSNCITEIPQDIKLEINDSGSLILKSGSKVYIPDGPGVFTPVTISGDHQLMEPATDRTSMLVVDTNGNFNWRHLVDECFSGADAPTTYEHMLWYDTTNNVIKMTNNSGETWSATKFSFPVCIASRTLTTCSIDQVFNGIGFIGSTAYVLPGVKILTPAGRNSNGTLKSLSTTISEVKTSSATNSDNKCFTVNNLGVLSVHNGSYENETKPVSLYAYWYKPSLNIAYDTRSGAEIIRYETLVATFSANRSGKITSFSPKTVFNAANYDTEFIANQAMPSNKYIDLTLGASGTTYTAPADGYFTLNKGGSSGNWAFMLDLDSGLNTGVHGSGSYNFRLCLPARKGARVQIQYSDGNQSANHFRFVYVDGVK